MMNAMIHGNLEDEQIKKGLILIYKARHIILFCLCSLATLSDPFTCIDIYENIHHSTRVVPRSINVLEGKSSIFGQTGISCLSVRVINSFVTGIHSLSFSSALCGA